MNFTKLIAAAFLSCFLHPGAWATNTVEYKNVSNLNVEHGLSHYTVNGLHTDKFGVLWIGTSYGLNKVVGESVETYTKENCPGLGDNNISDICGDQAGHVFILGHDGISMLDQKAEKFSAVSDCRSTAFACNGENLFFADGTQVSEYDVNTGRISKTFSIDSLKYGGIIKKMAVSANSSLFLCTASRLLKVSPEGQVLTSIEISSPNNIMLDSKGCAWVSMKNNGLCRMSPEMDCTFFRHDESVFSPNFNNVRAIVQTSPSTYYVGSFGGLSVLDTRTGEFKEIRIYRKYHDDCSQSIRNLNYDGKGNLWIGTFFNGAFLDKLDGEEYSKRYIFSDSYGMPNRHILSATQDNSGHIWFCTSTMGLYRFDAASSVTEKYRQFPKLYTKSSCFDWPCRTLWVGTVDEGVYGIDIGTGRVKQLPKYTTDGSARVFNVLKIVPWGEEVLLLATSDGILKADKARNTVDLLSDEVRNQVWDLLVSGDDLWAVTNTSTIRYDLANGRIRQYPFSLFQCIHQDRLGRLWFGSRGNGLFLYDESTDSFKAYDEGLSEGALFITDISDSPDPDAMLVGTNCGLYRFGLSSESFSVILEDTMVNADGLFYSTTQNCAYVCSLNDAFALTKGTGHLQSHRQKIYFTDLYVSNAKVLPGDETGILDNSMPYTERLNLKNSLRDISLRVSGPEDLCYRLEPSETDFEPVGNDGIINIHSLKSGRYTLTVKGNGPGDNAESISIPIRVTPPFYRNPLVIILLVLLLLSSAVVTIVGYMKKLSLQVQLEKEKNEKESIEKFNRSKLDFFTNVSHEFKTPLTIIGGLSEMLVEKVPDDSEFNGICRSINDSSSRLRQLIDELIDFRKKDRTSICPDMAYGDLAAMCRRVFESFICYADKRGIKYSFEAQSNEIITRFDASQLEKVIFNILSNAFKFTRDSISVGVRQNNGFAEITVRDNGAGIPENEITNLFEPFKPGTSKNSGTGIGLAFSKDITTAHNGTIEVESQEGYWTAFTVRIPVVNSIPAKEKSAGADEYTSVAGEGKDNSLMIIDDNPEVIKLLKMYFSDFYNLRCAPTAAEGIKICEEFVPDLILTDVMMDGLSGIELCRHLKSHPQTSHIPVILISADSTDETILEGLEAGADDYVTKPFSLKVLHSKCRRIMEARKIARDEYRTNPDAGVESLVEDTENSKILKMAEEIVDANISNPEFSIPEFAKMMGLSRTYLFTKIKGITGLTPNDFIINRKLKQAAIGMISNPDKRISDIAYEFGFSAPSYFSKCFKDLFGMTPAEYRKSREG